jgi:hypothetical protein
MMHMDPYAARDRTVRIGKWRWPPPKEDAADATDAAAAANAAVAASNAQQEGFFEFKMRKMNERKHSNERGKEEEEARSDDGFDSADEIQGIYESYFYQLLKQLKGLMN